MLTQGQPLFFADVVSAAAAGEITRNHGPRLHDWWTKSPPPPDPDPPKFDPPEKLHVTEIAEWPIEERGPARAKAPEPGLELELFKAAIKLAPIASAKAAKLMEDIAKIEASRKAQALSQGQQLEKRMKLWSEAVEEEILGTMRKDHLERLRGWWNQKEAAAQKRALENQAKLQMASRIRAENPHRSQPWKDVLKNGYFEHGVVV